MASSWAILNSVPIDCGAGTAVAGGITAEAAGCAKASGGGRATANDVTKTTPRTRLSDLILTSVAMAWLAVVHLLHLLSRMTHLSPACFWQFVSAANLASSTDLRTAPPQAGPESGVANAAHIFIPTPNRTLQASEPQSRFVASLARSCDGSSHAKPLLSRILIVCDRAVPGEGCRGREQRY
jgi:hypothetical protein